MSGEKDYVSQRMDVIVDNLEKVSKTLLIDKVNVNPQAEKYLSLDEDDLSKMTPAELATGEYILSAHNLRIQRTLNRATAVKNWAGKCIDRIIADSYKNYDSMIKYEIRKALVAKNDDFAKRLSDIMMNQDSVIDELTHLVQSIGYIINSLGNLARVRSKNNALSP